MENKILDKNIFIQNFFLIYLIYSNLLIICVIFGNLLEKKLANICIKKYLIFYINLSLSTFLNIKKPIINKIRRDDMPNFGEEKI